MRIKARFARTLLFVLWFTLIMTTITIPKNITRAGNLIAIPFEEYERLLSTSFPKKEVTLTLAQKKRLQSARENLGVGKSLTFNELRKKLGVKN